MTTGKKPPKHTGVLARITTIVKAVYDCDDLDIEPASETNVARWTLQWFQVAKSMWERANPTP